MLTQNSSQNTDNFALHAQILRCTPSFDKKF